MIILLAIVAACYATLSHLMFHNTFKNPYGFFGRESWRRKYKRFQLYNSGDMYDFYPNPNNWYYRLFKIKYKEAFPLSATTLVFVTDGYHLVQWIMLKALFLLIALHTDGSVNWYIFFGAWAVWSIMFNIVYISLKKINNN
jgi:hypothetical protein